jgi:hypothetical protein
MKKILLPFLMVVLGGGSAFAQSQSKSLVCVWVDSEQPGTLIASQPGGAIQPVASTTIKRIQQLAVEGLQTDKSNAVVNPCPQTGKNIELDVVVGRFRGGFVASVSTTVQGEKDGHLHISSNVVAAGTERILASDVVIAYESTKFRVQTGLVGK